MKKILLILPILLIAGAAAWWFLLRTPPVQSAAAATADASSTEVKYIQLKPLLVPAVRDGVAEKILRIDVALELQSPGAGPKVDQALPRLTDAFVIELYSLLGHRQMEAERYDAGIIKRRLQMASARVLGPGLVSDVLIRGMAVTNAQ